MTATRIKKEASSRFLAALHNERDKDKELLTGKEKDRRQRSLVVAGNNDNHRKTHSRGKEVWHYTKAIQSPGDSNVRKRDKDERRLT